MKKIFVSFLIVSFINLTGCYSHKLLSPSAYRFDEKKEITIITKDTMYNFRGNQYVLVNDTLIATTAYKGINTETLQPQDVRVPVEEMQLIEVTKEDGVKTTLVFFGILALLALVVYISASSSVGGADIHLN